MDDLISPHVKDSRKAIIQLKVFTAFLDSMIMFAIFAIVFSVFGLSLLIGFGPALLYFFYKLYSAFREQAVIGRITRKNPGLDESLQAAYDNRSESNVIATHLIKEVSRKLEEMQASSFLERRDVAARVFFIVFLFFGIIAINSMFMQDVILKMRETFIGGFSNFLTSIGGGDEGSTMSMGGGDNWEAGQYGNKEEKQKIGGQAGGKTPGYSEGPLPGQGGGVGTQANKNIVGAPTTAKIEGKNINLEVHPEYGGQISIEDTETKANANTNFRVPEDVEAAQNPDQEPVQYAEVIKNYFDKLSAEAG